MKRITIIAFMSFMFFGQAYAQTNQKKEILKNTEQKEHYTFQLSDKVTRQAVTFKNRFGIILSGDLYLPKNSGSTPLAALAIRRTLWCG